MSVHAQLLLPEGWDAEMVSSARAEEQPVFQYPAMMVSPMQGALLDAVVDQRGGGQQIVLDCFVGSGTTMIESQRRALHFVGLDINPLAILICKVESCEADLEAAEAALHRVHRRAQRRTELVALPHGRWVEKWFRQDVARTLAALQEAIRREDDPAVRRILWVTLCEVARRSGNHRIDAPKLQTRSPQSLERPIDAFGDFLRTGNGVLATLARRSEQGRDRSVRLILGDVRSDLPNDVRADILLTSPPYGTNHTTMPYGQVSFLPLRWVDHDDIQSGCDTRLLNASKTLDTASLGGSKRVDALATQRVAERSRALSRTLSRLDSVKRDGWSYTASFFNDLAAAFDAAGLALAADAHVVLTLGDKTTYGVAIPTATIVRELLESSGYRTLDVLSRRIGRNKRLPTRTRQAQLIGTETVLVMRRGA